MRLIVEVKKMSDELFSVWKFVKGRRRVVLGGIGYVLGLMISDSQLVGAISAGAVEILWGLGEWYFKK